jgi:hypothetical protein
MQAPNIQWMKAAELMKYIADHSEEFASQTLKQAETGFTELANGQFVKNVIETTATDRFMYPATTASAAAAEAGTALAESATSSTANLALVSSASGTTGTAGILSLAAPVGASLLAAVGGYLIGNQVYENNQSFFDGITGPLMKYLADGTVNLMGLMDKDGNTYLDKRAYDAVKNYLDNIPPITNPAGVGYIPKASIKPTCNLANNLMTNYITFYKDYSWQYFACGADMVRQCLNLYYSKLSELYPGKMIEAELHSSGSTFPLPVFRVMKEPTSDPYIGYYDGYYYINCSGAFDAIYCETDFNGTYADSGGYFKVGSLPYPASPTGKVYLYMEVATAISGKSWSTLPITNSKNGCYGSNMSAVEKSGLPAGVTQYTPKSTSLTNLLLHTTVDGCPTELPFIPVRFPTSPNVIPFPTPDENPSENDPEKKPDLTPFVDPNPPYPDNVPNTPKKPLPTPEENPDKKPCVLPNPIPNPDPTPDNTPDPNTDPSQQPDPTTDVTPTPTPDDPTVNPDDGGKTPTNNVPVVVPISGSADGLLHVYNPTSDEINQFGAWLWTTFSTNFLDTIAKLFNNPMDAVIGLHEIYIKPTDGATKVIKAGFQDSPVSAPVVTKRYEEINCGSIVIQEHWGNYLDYSPYTKVYCYLPFIGIVDLEADDIIAHAINITYRVDTYTGACIAIITVAKEDYNSVTYQFSGNCSVQVPITSGVMTALQNVIIGAATAGIGAMAAKGVTLSRIANAEMAGGIRRGVNSKNEVQHSGSFGANFGAMGIKKPYIIVKRPKQKVVPGYNVNYGYPAHKMVAISECSGYTRVREVDVISVTATEDEKKLIETMLKAGIFVS